MAKHLLAFPDLCTGCNRCTYVCSAVKEGLFIPARARIHIQNFPLHGYSVPCICFQCPKPECLEACPEEAIYKNDEEVALVDQEKCNGCGVCVPACPYGMIELNADNLAYKCDYCGGEPACVEECYPGAIVFAEPDQEQKKIKALQMKHRSALSEAEKKRLERAEIFLKEARPAAAVSA